jgi:MFS family permease
VFPVALVLLALVGGGVILAAASANTIIQTVVDDRLRGRVAGFYTMAFLGIAPLGNLAAGALAKAIGVQATFAFNGILRSSPVQLRNSWHRCANNVRLDHHRPADPVWLSRPRAVPEISSRSR